MILEIVCIIFIIFLLGFCVYLNKKYIKLKNDYKINKRKLKNIQSLVNSSLDALLFVKDNKIIYANKNFLKISLYKNKKQILEKKLYELIESEIIDNKDIYTKLYKADESFLEIFIRTKKIELENEIFFILSIYDYSLIKEKNENQSEKNKLASMTEMLSNISHQWRQPLSAISSAASGLLIYKDIDKLNNNIVETFAQTILGNCNYLSETIDEFSLLLDKKTTKETIFLSALFKKCETLIKSTLDEEKILLKIDIKKDEQISTYASDFIQVLISLINNSKDAFIDNKIDIRMIFINVNINNSELEIEFFDNALGVKEEIINNIFEPYFTTKYKSEGKGLSLYTAYKFICEKLAGTISCANKQFIFDRKNYKGASFKIKIKID